MNVKKMFAVTAGVLLAAGAVLPTTAFGAASYGAELQGAYEYAFGKGITTMTSIDSANMYGELTRGQLAKMIANWSEAELGTKADETKVCSFTDANKAEGDLAMYVKKACQMGLMGQGIAAFRPNDKVTRGEFGTTLSRALWGDKYNTTETPYYKNHLVALKDAGIMKMIDTPNQLEIRGYVMLMLQRASEGATKDAQCKDPVIMLACTLGSETCPANCKGEDKPTDPKVNTGAEAKGDLSVTIADFSATVKTAPKGIFVANKVKFAVTENVNLESLTLKRTGLSTRTDIEKVWLERNGIAVTNAATVGSDGIVVLNFKNNKTLVTTDAKTQEFDLVIQLKADAATGNEVAFELADAKSTAKNLTIRGVTTTYRIAGYKVVELKVDDVNNNEVKYQLGQADYVIGQFALQSESAKDDRNVNVRSLTFRNDGSADFGTMFKNVKVYRDSKVVSNGVEVNGRDVTITLDKDVLKANKRALYTIRAEVANLERVGETVQLTLKNAKDLIADEDDTGFRTNVTFDNNWLVTSKGTFAKYTFDGGRVMLETKSGFPRTIDAGVGANDVTIAEGKITVRENVELPNLVIAYDANYASPAAGKWATNDGKGKDALKRLVLEVDGKRTTADNDGNGNFKFEDVVVKQGSVTVKLLASLDSTVTKNNVIKMPANLGTALMTDGNGEYQDNGEKLTTSDIAGSISISTISIKDAKFQLTAKNLSTVGTVVGDAAKRLVMDGKLSSKDKDVNVNSFKVKLVNNLSNATDQVDVYLGLNGQPFSNATLKNGQTEFTFNSLGTIKAGSDLPFTIEVTPTISSAQSVTIEVQAEGSDDQGNPAITSKEYTAKLDVKPNAVIEVTNAISSDRVVEPTVNAVLYEGTLNVTDGSTELTAFKFTEAKGAALTVENYKLYIDDNFVADAASPDFAGLTENLQEGKRKVTVKANVTSNASTTPADFVYGISDVTVNGANSQKKANTYFAKGFFTLAKKSDANGVVTVTLRNNSPKTVDIKSLDIDPLANVASASVNGQIVELPAGTVAVQSVPAGAEIEIQFTAKKDETVTLKKVTYDVVDGGNTYGYALDSTNTAVGSWGSFVSSK
ncbi:MAG: hypothetical protein Q4B28_00915 [bacterium]|nr:hypothetical protein [bacterium]